MKSELRYWEEKTRKIEDLNLENSIINNKKHFSDRKMELFDKIEEEFKKLEEKSLEKARMYAHVETVDRDAQVERLRRIFDYYVKKNVKETKLFEDLGKKLHKMSLESYLNFIK